jgi:hypothetical protein
VYNKMIDEHYWSKNGNVWLYRCKLWFTVA